MSDEDEFARGYNIGNRDGWEAGYEQGVRDTEDAWRRSMERLERDVHDIGKRIVQ